MKIVISQPMNGLTQEQIETNRATVMKELIAAGHEIVDSYITVDAPKNMNAGLFYLGLSLQIIASQADAVYFLDGWQNARGCWMEFEACKRYGVKTLNTE